MHTVIRLFYFPFDTRRVNVVCPSSSQMIILLHFVGNVPAELCMSGNLYSGQELNHINVHAQKLFVCCFWSKGQTRSRVDENSPSYKTLPFVVVRFFKKMRCCFLL